MAVVNEKSSNFDFLSSLTSDIGQIIADPAMQRVYEAYDKVSQSMRSYLSGQEGFLEFKPPLIGPVTDPGTRGAKQTEIEFYGKNYKFMSSGILYKQLLAINRQKAGYPGRIYFFADNLRMEPLETANTDRHLAEFIQVDLEIVDADHFDAMEVAEGLVRNVYKDMSKHEDLLKPIWSKFEDSWGPRGLTPRTEIKVPSKQFKKYEFEEAVAILQSHIDENPTVISEIEERFKIKVNTLRPDMELPWEYEWLLSSMHDEPFFIHDYPRGARGFYDREYEDKKGYLMDFDLLFPHGYGEAISGAAREYDHRKVIPRMKESGESLGKYKWYLDFLHKHGKPTAGFGIGLERTVRYFCALPSIMMALPYPKVPGVFNP